MLTENDNSIQTTFTSDNATIVNNNAAENADLKVRIGAQVGQSDSAFAGLQAALGAQQAEIAVLKQQFSRIGEQRPSGSQSSSSGKFQSILDLKAASGLEKLQGGVGFLSWANRFRNCFDQFRIFGREAT